MPHLGQKRLLTTTASAGEVAVLARRRTMGGREEAAVASLGFLPVAVVLGAEALRGRGRPSDCDE